MPPLSREFLLSRGSCCHHNCVNCPYDAPKMHEKSNEDHNNCVFIYKGESSCNTETYQAKNSENSQQ
jgi:hypothetical protein